MPINAYFHGHGEEVKQNMTREYGQKKGERVFYATASKRHAKPGQSGRKSSKMTEKRR